MTIKVEERLEKRKSDIITFVKTISFFVKMKNFSQVGKSISQRNV